MKKHQISKNILYIISERITKRRKTYEKMERSVPGD
jgi:hypothetical protein